MQYKTVLVHVDHARHAEARIRCAAALARRFEAHLIGTAASGISRYVYQDSGLDMAMTVLASHVEQMRQRAEATLGRFDALAAQEGVASVEHRMADDEPGAALAIGARYADLLVVSQADPDDPAVRLSTGLAPQLVLDSVRPVLVLPYIHDGAAPGKRVLVCWDGSPQASRAVHAALPLLAQAEQVTVAVFNPGEEHGEAPGADLALYLARHGVKAEAQACHTDGDVGQQLLSLAADLDCDLMVMGCYGHTRLRELLLGGVSATMFASMTVPVLMMH